MSQTRKIGKHKTKVTRSLEFIIVRYHNTDVVSTTFDTVTLKTGGFKSVTTKRRMNQAAVQFRLGYNVYQEKYAWYVRRWLPNGDMVILPFEGSTISFPRKLNPENFV